MRRREAGCDREHVAVSGCGCRGVALLVRAHRGVPQFRQLVGGERPAAGSVVSAIMQCASMPRRAPRPSTSVRVRPAARRAQADPLRAPRSPAPARGRQQRSRGRGQSGQDPRGHRNRFRQARAPWRASAGAGSATRRVPDGHRCRPCGACATRRRRYTAPSASTRRQEAPATACSDCGAAQARNPAEPGSGQNKTNAQRTPCGAARPRQRHWRSGKRRDQRAIGVGKLAGARSRFAACAQRRANLRDAFDVRRRASAAHRQRRGNRDAACPRSSASEQYAGSVASLRCNCASSIRCRSSRVANARERSVPARGQQLAQRECADPPPAPPPTPPVPRDRRRQRPPQARGVRRARRDRRQRGRLAAPLAPRPVSPRHVAASVTARRGATKSGVRLADVAKRLDRVVRKPQLPATLRPAESGASAARIWRRRAGSTSTASTGRPAFWCARPRASQSLVTRCRHHPRLRACSVDERPRRARADTVPARAACGGSPAPRARREAAADAQRHARGRGAVCGRRQAATPT